MLYAARDDYPAHNDIGCDFMLPEKGSPQKGFVKFLNWRTAVVETLLMQIALLVTFTYSK